MIRNVTIADAAAIARIYNWYIRETVITFEEEPVTAEEIAQRMADVESRNLPWIVFETREHAGDVNGDSVNTIVGYAYAGVFRSRCAFRYTVETAIYLDHTFHGKGVGFQLYDYLLNELRKKQLHAVIGGIALPNEPSVRLHEKCGFKKVAHFPKVGFKFNQWIDVGFWQLNLGYAENRTSPSGP